MDLYDGVPISDATDQSRISASNSRIYYFAGFIVLLLFVAAIPLYGILIPQLTDLPEHIITAKLLWEKVSGVSNLDLEVSWFLGYRLFSTLAAVVIGIFSTVGIPMIYLPMALVFSLIAVHAGSVAAVFIAETPERTPESLGFSLTVSIPAIAAMYSACWFIGFVGFTMGITLVMMAIFLTERHLRFFSWVGILALSVCLFLAYTAHPFAPAFWLGWCFGRTVASIVTGSILDEWRRLMLLGAAFLPLVIYHYLATIGTEMSTSAFSFRGESPIVTLDFWWEYRARALFDGVLLKADDAADSRLFAYSAVVLIIAAVATSSLARSRPLIRMSIALLILLVSTSLLNEKWLPTPGAHWLAYDYRYFSMAYVIALAISGVILVKAFSASRSSGSANRRVILWALALIAVLGAGVHLLEVRKAYARFDVQGRVFVQKLLSGESTNGVWLPHSRWHPDGTIIRHYICLEKPDCSPADTTFRVNGGELYPIKLLSLNGLVPIGAPSDPADHSPAGKLKKPRGLVAQPDGTLYIADTGNSRIQSLDAKLNPIAAFGTPGFAAGQLREPNGIGIAKDGSIFATDAANGKLIRFAPKGEFLREWYGPEPQLYGPRDLSIDPQGKVYLVDQGRGRIAVFDPENDRFEFWGTRGPSEGEFQEPTGIAVAGGRVFVADNGNSRIQVFGPNGNFLAQIPVPALQAYPWHYPDVAFDEVSKRLFVTNGLRNQILTCTFKETCDLVPFQVVPESKLDNPSAITIIGDRKDRKLAILNTNSGSIVIVPLN